MIKNIAILLFVFYSMSSFAHDIKLGVFEVNSTADHKISLVVKFDKNDILKELYTTCKDKSQVNDCIEQYINEHFKLTFDSKSVCFEMLEVDQSKEYITINL